MSALTDPRIARLDHVLALFAKIAPEDKAKLRNIVLAAVGLEPLDPASPIPASELPGVRRRLMEGALNAERRLMGITKATGPRW
jgi:hypothetical protein